MAEIWGAAIAAGGALLSAYSANKEAKEARADQKAATKEEAIYSSVLSQFNAEQEDYYSQLNKQRKERGLDQFRNFSTVSLFAPQYQGDTARVVVPERPNIQELLGAAVPSGNKADKQSGGIFSKLDDAENKVRRVFDPIGAKISRKDPVRKAIKKIF